MAENNFNADDKALALEDEMVYKTGVLSAVTFYIVRGENDLDRTNSKGNSFKPDMAHQIFGETELIFGYKNLTIDLFYLHNSAKCYVAIQSTQKIVEKKGCKADDVLQLLNAWLPMNYRTNWEDFQKDFKEENHTIIFGEVIQEFEDTKGSKYKVTLCDMENEAFKTFHQRYETFIVWFIDGANYIDLEDSRWTVFYIYEEYVDSENNEIRHSPIGFCAVYKFFSYPNMIRPRISQFFILPTHQRQGLGTFLYNCVYSYLRELPGCVDITVEIPTETFQKIRDYCDSFRLYKDMKDNKISISTQNKKKINELLMEHKICKRQGKRVFDILECLASHKNGYDEYMKFTKNIRAQIAAAIEKGTRGSKRLCNNERTSVTTTHHLNAIIEAEYNRYIDSLEWPTNRLRAQLAKMNI